MGVGVGLRGVFVCFYGYIYMCMCIYMDIYSYIPQNMFTGRYYEI